MSDLDKLFTPHEQTVEIVAPATGIPFGLRMTVISLDDDRLKRIKRNITDESLKLQAKGKAFKVDELERNSKALLFGATTRWEWYNPTGEEGDDGFDPEAKPGFDGEKMSFGGPTPDFNQKNFYSLIEKYPPISDQLREALEDSKGFFDNSKAS